MSLFRFRCIVLAMGVLSLSLVSTRFLRAGERPPTADKPRVVVVQAKVDAADVGNHADIGKAVSQALEGKLDKLPEKVRAALKKKLAGLHLEVAHGKPGAKPVVSARQLELKVEAAKASGTAKGEKPNVFVLRAGDAKDASAGKKICVAVVAAEGDGAASKTMTVQIKDGQVLLNGKPLPMPKTLQLKAEKATAAKPASRSIKRRINVRLDKAPAAGNQATHRHMVWIDKDGKHHEVDVNVVVDVARDGTATATARASKPKPAAHKTAVQPRIRVRAMRLDAKHPPHAVELNGMPHAQMRIHHADAKNQADEAKTHQEVVKQLRAIEAELRKIRQVLETMKKK